MNDEFVQLQSIAKSMNVGGYKGHVFQCIGPDCCTPEQGDESWQYLKRRLNELGPQCPFYRTKVNCLRMCTNGPIAVVYPDGTWYAKVTPEVWEKIIQRHLLSGTPVAEHAFASNPLSVGARLKMEPQRTGGTP